MLGDGQQLDMREAEVLHVRQAADDVVERCLRRDQQPPLRDPVGEEAAP